MIEYSSWIMILGSFIQSIPIIGSASILFGASGVVGAVSLLEIYTNVNISNTLGITTCVVGGLFSFIVYNAPFRIINMLNGTISDLTNITGELETENNLLKQRISSLELVERGLKQTSENLLKMLTTGSKNNSDLGKLLLALEAISDDIETSTNIQTKHMSEFMKALLALETLEGRLHNISRINDALNERLENALSVLNKITKSQQKLQFDSELDDLARWIKAKAADGLIESINSDHPSINKDQASALVNFFTKLEKIIKLHDETLQIDRSVINPDDITFSIMF